MQAASAEAPFSSPDYLFEVKWDGLRCILFRDVDGAVRLQDRGLHDITADLPEVVAAARRVPPGSVIDGELVATDNEGRPDYPRLRERLATLRNRLRGLPPGLEAIAEYESARERLLTLASQSEDLNRTVETLRQLIDETRRVIQARFDETFASVAERFTARFSELFGGGIARLVLADDGENGGIDVLAQPPGKRAQNLALLSGGERALTAAALIFALIETNPPPFCVLDEVDAALDENNVGRFCEALRDLSARTQFVVITHNRRTMEAAAAIYGLTLENRSESRVLSMRLPVDSAPIEVPRTA